MADVERAAAALRDALDRCRVTGRSRYHAELVFEEVVTNVIRHSDRGEGAHVIDIDVSLAGDGRAVVLTFEDDGSPFDPLQRPDPQLPKSIADAPVGGLGILVMRMASTDSRYERTANDRNRLTVTVGAA